jgi:DNA-binding FadR family transcriptional regulator
MREWHGVARNTVREAMRILADEGLVVAKHGVGVFVRTAQDPPKITLRAAAYDYAFNVPLTLAQIKELAEGRTVLLEFGPDTELQLGDPDPQNLNLAVILRPAPRR